MMSSIIKGWDIDKSEFKIAHKNNRLIKLVTELSNVCNLSCESCFTKKIEGSWTDFTKTRLPGELTFNLQKNLIDEATLLGIKTVDIVGSGEPTLDKNFESFVNYCLEKNVSVVVFSHGGFSNFPNYLDFWKEKNVSFVVKLWSKKSDLQNALVNDFTNTYTRKRDLFLENLFDLGYNSGESVLVDGISYKSTKVGADILVMKSNYDEIPDLFRFCRNNNIMPEIKTYIPEGPTKFSELSNKFNKLKSEEISFDSFLQLRRKLEEIDKYEFGISPLGTIYPQGSKCTQSVASLYVTIQGDIRSCVGSHIGYGSYEKGVNLLSRVLSKRVLKEQVSFGCIPRLEDLNSKGVLLTDDLKNVYLNFK